MGIGHFMFLISLRSVSNCSISLKQFATTFCVFAIFSMIAFDRLSMLVIAFWILSAELWLVSARLLTSCAITPKPFPASFALEASIEALNPSIFVLSAISCICLRVSFVFTISADVPLAISPRFA